MYRPLIAFLALAAVTLAVPTTARAQSATIEFSEPVTLHVTSLDTARVTRFALVGAGLSFMPLDATTVLGDTIFLYTPAKFTITRSTALARIVSLSNEPTLRLAAGVPGGTPSAIEVEGRTFEIVRQPSAQNAP